MSRASRIPYHQNVYDLLQIEPGESPEAARMIAEHEAKHGPLPASVREWYLVPDVVPLEPLDPLLGVLWYRYGDGDMPYSLRDVLNHAALNRVGSSWPYVRILEGHQNECSWWVIMDGSEDPSVYDDWGSDDPSQWEREAQTFNEFVTSWFLDNGYSPRAPLPQNRLWLRTPAEPFCPPVIDFLTEQLGEPGRTPRPGNVTTYTWRPPGGTIRVTADEPGLGGGLSAWWLHAESPERLAELARLVMPFGTLRETLRADTDVAREVLIRARSG